MQYDEINIDSIKYGIETNTKVINYTSCGGKCWVTIDIIRVCRFDIAGKYSAEYKANKKELLLFKKALKEIVYEKHCTK